MYALKLASLNSLKNIDGSLLNSLDTHDRYDLRRRVVYGPWCGAYDARSGQHICDTQSLLSRRSMWQSR